MLIRGHAWIAQRSEQDGVKLVAQHFDSAGRQTDALAKVFVGSPVEFDEFDVAFGRPAGGPQHLHGFGRDLFADAVSRNDRDTSRGTTTTQGRLRHASSSERLR